MLAEPSSPVRNADSPEQGSLDHPDDAPVSVALVTTWLSSRSGGLCAATIPLARVMGNSQKKRFRIVLFGLDRPDEQTSGVTQIVPHFGPRSFPVAPKLGRDLLTGRFDVVHTHGLWSWPSIAARQWKSRSIGATIISPHGMLDPWALANSGWKKRLALRLFERENVSTAFCIHALNQSEAESIRTAGFRNPIVVIPNGVDLPDPGSGAFAAPWPADGRKVLLFLGRIHPKKGLDPLIRAWARLKEDEPDITRSWRLIVAGWDDGGYAAAMKVLAAKFGCSNDVNFPGPVFGKGKSAAYAAAAAFVLPSFSEGLPMTVLEAFSYGVPVFASTACNLLEGVESGAIVPVPTDPEGLASVLASVLRDPSRLASMSASGRKLATERFVWTNIVDMWTEVYYWAAGRGPAPSSLLNG